MGKRVKRMVLAAALSLILCISASAALPDTLVPVGKAVGLTLETDGVYVVSFAGEKDNAASKAGIQAGDRISAVNGNPITSVQGLCAAVNQSGGAPMVVQVLRKDKEMSYTLCPQAQAQGGYRLGLYVRDAIVGIGTVTFYDPQTTVFGALGHGVNESSTAVLLPLKGGLATNAEIVGVKPGQKGSPGQLKGTFSAGNALGTIGFNTDCGIFGQAASCPWDGSAVPVASAQEVTTGSAEIWANVSGTSVEHYTVTLEKVELEEENGRNFCLKVSDPRLLSTTGGIVQGMSGSPILQDGKLIGAVTHVLVNDPTRGYGIFIGNMLEYCGYFAE